MSVSEGEEKVREPESGEEDDVADSEIDPDETPDEEESDAVLPPAA